MRQLLRCNFVALPLLITAVVGLVVCLLLSGHAPLWWLAEIAPVFTLLIMVSGTWLLFKLGIWAMKPAAIRWLGAIAVATASAYTQSVVLLISGLLFLALASAYWWYQRQFRPASYQMTRKEQMYWVWLNEFADGSISVLPRRP